MDTNEVSTKTAISGWTDSEITLVLEVAYSALADGRMRADIAERMDISDDEIAATMSRLNAVLSTDQPAAEQASTDAIERAVATHVKESVFLRRLSTFLVDEIDMDHVYERVADNVEAEDVATSINLNNLAERIDLNALAAHLIKQDGALVTLAAEMVAYRYEDQLRAQNRAEELLKQRIEELTATNNMLERRTCGKPPR